nr:MAG TPA: hypothetical protein [Bacteriophage sp.]
MTADYLLLRSGFQQLKKLIVQKVALKRRKWCNLRPQSY